MTFSQEMPGPHRQLSSDQKKGKSEHTFPVIVLCVCHWILPIMLPARLNSVFLSDKGHETAMEEAKPGVVKQEHGVRYYTAENLAYQATKPVTWPRLYIPYTEHITFLYILRGISVLPLKTYWCKSFHLNFTKRQSNRSKFWRSRTLTRTMAHLCIAYGSF